MSDSNVSSVPQDGREWIAAEKILRDAVLELREERDWLREIVRLLVVKTYVDEGKDGGPDGLGP